MLVLGRNRGRLLPLAVETVVNQRMIGIDSSVVGTIAPCSTGSRAAPLGGKECRLCPGVSLAGPFAGGGRGAISGLLLTL